MDDTEFIETMKDCASAESNIRSGWEHILDEVKSSLPGIDSDSEMSTISDDGNNPVFNRKVGIFDTNDTDSDSTGNCVNFSAERHEASAINSDGYASASSSSPTSNTSSTTIQAISADAKTNLSCLSPPSNNQHTSLLFQRLQKHLKDNVHQMARNNDDMKLSDAEIELPIYEIEKAVLYDGLNDLIKSESPPPLDMQSVPALKRVDHGSETSSGIVSTDEIDAFAMELLEDTGKAPVLSLRGLEEFDLDDLLDDVLVDETVSLDEEISPRKLKTGQPDIMNQLVDLSKSQRGSAEDISRRLKDSCDLKEPFLKSGQFNDELGGKEKESMKRLVEGKVDISAEPPSASCMDFAKVSSNTQLSLSEPTTIFLDLRPGMNDHKDQVNCEEEIMKPVKQVKSSGVSTMSIVEVSDRVKNLSRMCRVASVKSDSESDDEDYTEWQAVRRRIKERSTLTATSSPKRHNVKKFTSDAMSGMLNHELKSDINVPTTMSSTKNSESVVKSFGDNITDITHIDQCIDDSDSEPSPQELDDGLKILEGEINEKSNGIYARQRLKEQNCKCVKSTLKDNMHVTEESKKGKTTVTFAEEPKKDDLDTTNVYRAKAISSSLPASFEDTSKKAEHESATSSAQTVDSFSTRPSLHEVVQDRLLLRDDYMAMEKSTLRKKDFCKKNAKDLGDSKLCFENLYSKPYDDRILRETRLKLKVLLEREETKLGNDAHLLYEMDASFEEEIAKVPPSLNADKAQMVLLTINMSSAGCIVTHRTSGGHKATPVDASVGFSITYPLLISWLLALVPENLSKLHQARMDDTFALDIDPELVPELTNGKDCPSIPISVDIPFNVVALHQSWQEDTQSLSLQAVVVPNFFYKPESKRGRKKAKKEDAFLQVVWHFLQSNRINDICPWHDKPESPIHYSLSEIIVTCATKPMSTYVAASNDPVIIRKVLNSKPGMFAKMMLPDDQMSIPPSEFHMGKLQTTMCLLQKEAFMFPTAVLDIMLRLQTSCFDLSGVRLCYATRRFINDNTLYHSTNYSLNPLEVVPCVVMAIRGHNVITKLSKIIGPRDPILARLSERSSLNATYGEQLSIKRGDDMTPTDVNMFCYPRSETRAHQQICVWFSGRVDPEIEPYISMLNSTYCGGRSLKQEKNGAVKGNGKNVKNKSRCNSTQEENPKYSTTLIKGLLCDPAHIVTCCDTKLFLVISPRLPTQFISDVLYTVTHQGFQLHGVRRFRLNERKAAALALSSRYYPCFCPRLDTDVTIEFDYYEDIWWIRPATVMLLSRENAVAHQAGLIHALQTDLMVNLSPPEEEGHMKVITYQCFHTTPYTEATDHVLCSLSKVPEVELSTGSSPRSFYSNPEMEQVVVLTLLGERAIDGSGEVLRNLLHGEFPLSDEEKNLERYSSQLSDDEADLEHFRGFELLGLKWLPSLSGMQANELSPFEVGTTAWHESLPILQSSPVLLFVLRRVNAFQVLQEAMRLPRSSYTDEDFDKENFSHVMSTTPEIAYRQMKTFFSDKELFPDNQSRPLLKYLPPPTRVHQYRQQQNIKLPTTDNDTNGSGDQQSSFNGSGSRTDGSKRSSTKRKKKQAKKDGNNNTNHNGNGAINSSLSLPDESIFSSMVACQQPLTSVIIIKPDAFPRHFIKIFRQLHYEGFHVVAMNVLKMSENEASQIVPHFLKDMQGESQVYADHMTSGLSLVACVQRDNAIRHLCELAGPHDPRLARSKCYLQHKMGSVSSVSRATWRALYGIDNISNGIHVSDSYLSACEEMKLFFPEGLCCQETLELKMELVPTPAKDPYMCADRTLGRKVSILPDERQTNHTTSLRVTYMPRKPVVVILMPPLFKQKNPSKNHSNPLVHTLMGKSIPPYVEILDQLLTQGFEICAMRMAWIRETQAEQILKILNYPHCYGNMISTMSQGPSLLVVLQRENALVLFDSILGSTKSNGESLYHKYSKHILRSQKEEQTKEATKYLFPRIPFPNSVITISHKLMEWKDMNGYEGRAKNPSV